MSLNTTANQWQAFSLSCVRVETEVEIARPAQQVFNYVTTPALWHTWHPATVEVRDVPQRPLTTGETMLELVAVAGRRDQALWTVLACMPPQLWEIGTDTDKGTAHISYRITDTDAGCRFHRTLEFRSKGWWHVLDTTLTRWIMERQSSQALRNLKAVLER
ncbi:SRPBCC family protein [Paraherbaspirillum soli]|uniref:SRPBCC family protein n=1 Tax=Paraherbaspirillum soli TaxID=631222 RepID=A0ABW0ME86_9BURK